MSHDAEDPVATLRAVVRRHASRDISTYILDTTLAYCGGELPTDPEDLAELLSAHLHTAARLLLGAPAADVLVRDAQNAMKARLPAGSVRTGNTTTLFASSAFEAVLVVSNDEELASAMRRSVNRRVRVSSIPTHGVMDDELDETALRARFIVSEPPSRCPALERAIDRGTLDGATLVLLRGANSEELEDAMRRAPKATFVRCAQDATALDIAMLLPLGAPRSERAHR